MKSTAGGGWIGFFCALSVLAGCSGKYRVDGDPANGAGAGGSGAGGSSVSTAGTDSNGTAGDISLIGVAGAPSAAGAPGLSYCGVAYSTSRAPAFATPDVVWKRLQLFLDTGLTASPMLPPTTTRQWAGDVAMNMLDALGGKSAPGLEKFVTGWLSVEENSRLVASPSAAAWAALLSTKGATLRDLLTTNSVRNPGSGVLTDDIVMSSPSPDFPITFRAKFILDKVLCTPAPSVPPGLPVPFPPPKPGQTHREELAEVVALPACGGCHAEIDGPGFALEHFDSTGNYRDLDNGSPIDSSGSLLLNAGMITFDGANDLGAKLAAQCEAALCLTERLLADAEGSSGSPAGITDPYGRTIPNPGDSAPIAAAFAASKGDLRTLIREIIQSDEFLRAQ